MDISVNRISLLLENNGGRERESLDYYFDFFSDVVVGERSFGLDR